MLSDTQPKLSRQWNVSQWIAAACLAAVIGCGPKGPEGPPTVSVSGKVVFTKNGTLEPLVNRQASVQFQSIDQPEVRALGEIAQDGSFTVSTILPGGSKKGAVPGKHQVRLFMDEGAAAFVSPRFAKFETSGITVDVPDSAEGAQDVVVEVWR